MQGQDFKKFNIGIGLRFDNIMYSPTDKEAFNNPRFDISQNFGGAAQTILTYNTSANIGLQLIPSVNYKKTKFYLYEIGGSLNTSGTYGDWETTFVSLESDLLFRYTVPVNILNFNFAAGLNAGVLGRYSLKTGRTTAEFTDNGSTSNSSWSTRTGVNEFRPTGGIVLKSGIGLLNNRIELNITYHYNFGNYNIPEPGDAARLEEYVDDPGVFQGRAHRIGLGIVIRLY